jgi:hypothetical protein
LATNASVSGLTQKSLFGIAPESPHRDAIAIDSMIRNGRIIHNADLDSEGGLYSPLCFFLVAACRYLKVRLGAGHWRAALENLCSAEEIPELELFGLPSDTRASRFKAELNAAIEQAGFLDRTSLLNKDDRNVAVGLAVNWAIRLLLAYAADFPNPIESPGRQDLVWLAVRVQAALQVCA